MRGNVAIGAALALFAPTIANAGDKGLAEQLFRKAQAIMQGSPSQADVHQACQLYKESYDNDAAVNTEVALAACYEKEGKNVSAWGLYTDAAAGNSPAAAYAKERADALQAKGFLKIRFDASGLPDDAKVTLDDKALGNAALRAGPIDADPGPHVVVVHSNGKDIEQRFQLTTASSPLTVALGSASAAQSASTGSTEPPAAQEAPAKGSPLPMIGLVTAGVGLAALGVGSVFGIVAASQQGSANCPSNVCKNEADASTLRGAITSANVSTVFFIVGGVLAAGGITLWLLAPKARASASAGLMPAPGGVLLRGAW